MVALSRASLDTSLLFLAIVGLIVALMTLRAVRAPHRIARHAWDEHFEIVAAVAGALFLTVAFVGHIIELVPALVLFLGVAATLCFIAHRLSMPGLLGLAAQLSTLVLSGIWGALFIVECGLPDWLETVALAGAGSTVLIAVLSILESFARESVLTHEIWRLPVAPPKASGTARRKVSLQLCCYAEPPEIVKETMNRLAALDYDNYEVLVCDNNTKDEALWRPLEAHCTVLNRKMGREVFRFFHVSPLPGAKAGALNWLLDRMAPDAEIIGVIDADYFSRKDFLARLTPYFDDPEIGYVQTPHDYRDYADSAYLSACYWEYMPANKIDWAGVSEYGGAFTIGTMCLLRTDALRRAGGWAEWCLTEDSEVSVRLRAVGYRGYYCVETFGWGLIPETFDDYKKQRFRWTAGPVQQLRRHWRLFLPAPLAPAMPGWTKLLEITRCVAPLMRLGGLLMGLASTVGVGIALATGAMEPIDLPGVVWGLLAIGALTWGVRTAHRYRLSGCTEAKDMIRGEIARASLTYVTLVAGIAGLSSKPLAWRRTPKFAITGADSPLAVALPETIGGTLFAALAALTLLNTDLWGIEWAALTAIGFTALAVRLFCAPVMAIMARKHADRTATAEDGAEPLRDGAVALTA